MTSSLRVVGVDPGPIPGVVMLTAGAEPLRAAVFQCDPDSLLWLVTSLLAPREGERPNRVVLAVERFIVAMRSSRLSHPHGAAITRDMVGAVAALGRDLDGVTVMQRCAGEVMPWASDKRLTALGLTAVTKSMPHARAAARHALYAAVRDCGLPDPLSTRGV